MLFPKTHSEKFNYLVEATPIATAIFTGLDMIIAAVNEPMLKIWGRGKEVIGLELLNALPELVEQPFLNILREVYVSGKSYSATEGSADLISDGSLTTFYFNYHYKVLVDADGQTIGIINTALDITELVLTKRKVIETKEHLAFALNAAEIGTWSFDLLNKTVMLDKGSFALLGKADDSEISYEELLKFVHIFDREKVMATILEATTVGKSGECDVIFRIYNRKHKTIWVRCKGKAYFDKDQSVTRFAGIIQNNTSEVKVQTELQRLAAIVDSSDDFCNYTDMEGNVIYINPAGKKLVGIDENSSKSRLKFAYHDEVSRAKIENEVLPILLLNGSWSGNLTLINQKNQERIPIFKQFHLIQDKATKTPICIAGIAKDLREEFEVRKILADKNKDLEGIVSELEFLANTVPPVVWTSKPNGELDFINRRWYDQTGKTEDQTLGTKWIESVHPNDVEEATLFWERSLITGTLYEVEFRVVTKEGDYRWFLVRALPLKNEDGKILKWYGTNTDIHNQKELEKQKDDFLAIASHELKTPVTSLKAYTQVVEAMFVKNGDERNAMLLNRMNKQIDRLTKLIDDLLNVTKIRAGKLQLNLSTFNFKELVDEVAEEVQKTSSKHHIHKIIKFDGDVRCDRDRIYQVLVNLLSNAIKYSPDNHKLDLLVTASRDMVQVSVKDYGIGIPPRERDKVFEQFYRVQGATDQTFAGMGLGLYICADIIKRLSGRIWVDSIQNEGSTFSFTVPISQ